MKFLDPDKPIATCNAEECDNCAVRGKVHCHFTRRDVISYYLLLSPTVLVGGAGIYHVSGWWLIPWVLIMIGCFSFVLTRVLCSHCPHYAEEGSTLRCRANYGSPKIWKYRPGPMTFWERAGFFAGFAIVQAYPVYFMITGSRLLLLMVYLATSAGFIVILKMYSCTQCMNFACPMNAVPDDVRRDFIACNPDKD